MKKVAVLIKDIDQQYEGLLLSLGALLDDVDIQMLVFNHEIANMDEAYQDNMEFLDEMEGQRISNNMANAEKYGFQHATIKEIAQRLKDVDLIIPF
ncbi:MAG: hypothetical protein HF978_03555 [Desulfobacteraceae bacterium]|nr:hypothetical protein [Desulfobacteraceae bacterium]MBC2754602.1 hypothetical protein [Desulfobacteraceae bacterium]